MEIFVLVLLLAAVLSGWFFYKRRSRPVPLSTDPVVRLTGQGTYEFVVVGSSRYRSALEKIYGNSPRDDAGKQVEAALVFESGKSETVRVDVQGQTVGYLPPDLAREYRRRLDEAGYLKVKGLCKARIMARHGTPEHAQFAVRLDLPQKHANGKPAPH